MSKSYSSCKIISPLLVCTLECCFIRERQKAYELEFIFKLACLANDLNWRRI